MQLQLTRLKAAEYARIRAKLFGGTSRLSITPVMEADPDYHRYRILILSGLASGADAIIQRAQGLKRFGVNLTSSISSSVSMVLPGTG